MRFEQSWISLDPRVKCCVITVDIVRYNCTERIYVSLDRYLLHCRVCRIFRDFKDSRDGSRNRVNRESSTVCIFKSNSWLTTKEFSSRSCLQFHGTVKDVAGFACSWYPWHLKVKRGCKSSERPWIVELHVPRTAVSFQTRIRNLLASIESSSQNQRRLPRSWESISFLMSSLLSACAI